MIPSYTCMTQFDHLTACATRVLQPLPLTHSPPSASMAHLRAWKSLWKAMLSSGSCPRTFDFRVLGLQVLCITHNCVSCLVSHLEYSVHHILWFQFFPLSCDRFCSLQLNNTSLCVYGVENRGQLQMPFLKHCPPYLMRKGLSLGLVARQVDWAG